MKEFSVENGMAVDSSFLQSPHLERETYALAHKHLPIICHDAVIEYKSGILLIKRNNYPANGEYWFLGGRLARGVPIEDSLKIKVKAECDLDMEIVAELGVYRTYFRTDPLGHGKGTDTINLAYFARSQGELKLDRWHSEPLILTPESYSEFHSPLHPYVQELLDKGMELLQKK